MWTAEMKIFRDIHNRKVKFTDERREHSETEHPEMNGQINKIK
jgi:hypothetical protein